MTVKTRWPRRYHPPMTWEPPVKADRPSAPPRPAAFGLGALLLVVIAVLLGGGPAQGGEAATGAVAKADALRATYEKLGKYNDFRSFTRRMAAVRALGEIAHPHARHILLEIVRKAKVLDDKAVATIALGAELDVATAKTLAGLVAQRPHSLLVQALADAFTRASDDATLTWLATDALRNKSRAVVAAALDAEYVHADPRCRERAQELFDIYSVKRAGMPIAHAAVRALGSIGGPQVRSFIIAAVGHDDWRVRLAAADVMAWQEPVDVNIRGALRRLLVDDQPVVRQRAAQTIGEAKMLELLPSVAARLDDPHLRTRAVAHEALVHMTDKDLGYGSDSWITWFERRPEHIENLKPSPSKSVATYYGVSIYSDRLIFIVDVSGSMALPRGTRETRMQVARAELQKVLTHLDPKTLFNVIVFSDKVKAWRRGEALATKNTVARALKWIDRTLDEPRGGTYMYAALQKAFSENPEMDTICLLTDGLATDGEPIVPEAILASVGGWNRYRRVEINTFALTLEKDQPDAVRPENLAAIKHFMRRLAQVTGGTCTVIDHAPK